jgi:ribosomal protein L18E
VAYVTKDGKVRVNPNLYLPQELMDEYRELARQNDRSLNRQVRRALERYTGDGRVAITKGSP